LQRYFKDVTLSHQYKASYSVGSFSSFLNWVDAGQDGLGYVRSVLTGNPTPSSPYDISAVSITDGFSPLLGVDATALNNITGKVEYRTTRNLNLNISSYQLVESNSNEFVIGLGYKFVEFNKVLKMKKTQNFSNDLTVNLDFSYRKTQSLIRKIEEQFTQATSGNIAKTICRLWIEPRSDAASLLRPANQQAVSIKRILSDFQFQLRNQSPVLAGTIKKKTNEYQK